MRKVILKAVALSGFDLGECWEAGDGREAIEILANHWVDLILTDLHMPGMNGLEMLKEIQKDEIHRQVPIVLITTEGSEKRIQEALSLGVKGYLQKPFHPEAVRDILTRIMEKADA